jgi:hypothetical protein
MIDAVEELVMSLGPSTMAGLMTTMSSSLSLAKAQAAFSVMVFATGPHSCSEDSTHDLSTIKFERIHNLSPHKALLPDTELPKIQ